MFKRTLEIFKNHYLIILAFTTVLSCEKDANITFNAYNFESSEITAISINYPVAQGSTKIATKINKAIEDHIIAQINLSNDTLTITTISEAVTLFNHAFTEFKNDFSDTPQKWEAFIDGEISYKSPEVICIAVNSYLDTGGAHGNTNVTFFNFDPQTGIRLKNTDLIGDFAGLSAIAKQKLLEKIKVTDNTETFQDIFFGTEFQLPETIGYSDKGVIILYNPYEIATYARGIIEFTIPFEDIHSFLNVN